MRLAVDPAALAGGVSLPALRRLYARLYCIAEGA